MSRSQLDTKEACWCHFLKIVWADVLPFLAVWWIPLSPPFLLWRVFNPSDYSFGVGFLSANFWFGNVQYISFLSVLCLLITIFVYVSWDFCAFLWPFCFLTFIFTLPIFRSLLSILINFLLICLPLTICLTISAIPVYSVISQTNLLKTAQRLKICTMTT